MLFYDFIFDLDESDIGVVWTAGKKFGHCATQRGVDKVWGNVSQRHQREASEVKPRVWDLQHLRVHHFVSTKKDINVYGTIIIDIGI